MADKAVAAKPHSHHPGHFSPYPFKIVKGRVKGGASPGTCLTTLYSRQTLDRPGSSEAPKYLIGESIIRRASRLGSSRALTLDRVAYGSPKEHCRAYGRRACRSPFRGRSGRSLVWHGPLCYSCVRIEVVLLAARRVNALLPAKRPGSGPEQGQGGAGQGLGLAGAVWVSALSCQPNGRGGPAGGIGGGGGGGGAAAIGSAPGPSVLPRT